MIKRIDKDSVQICCGNKCPIMQKQEDGLIKIFDDYGNFVTLKAEECKFLTQAANKLLDE
ncbi:hypothetical protein N9955_00725 [bacterium]|nr:hypothetical protein [bacterium]